ncbi:MAG: hypothetical protein LBR82_00340 [Desulfovibrio sp.]|nr:hypothetical protein [Desulfovibrio sp.]
MKPVIKKQTHYRVLLMRDDKESRTFSVRCGLLHFCAGLFLVMLLFGGGGIYGGLHFFTKYRELAAVQESRERENAEMRLQLERLVNLESLLKAGNDSPPQAKHTEVGTPDLPARGTAAANPPAPGPAERVTAAAAAPAAAGSAPVPATTSKPADTPPVQAESRAAEDKSESPAEERRDAPTETETDARAKTGDGFAPLAGEGSPLRVNEFSARNYGSMRLRISYELSTVTDGQRTVTGAAKYAAVTADGTRVDLPLQDQESSRFAIARMKPMQNTVRLPAGLKPDGITSIDILIEVADTVYRGNYPVRLQ